MSERRHAENNLLDYVKQNDQTIDQEGFNNIDGLVMTQISNMHFEESGIDIHSGNAKTIYEIYEEMKGRPRFIVSKTCGKSEDDTKIIG